MSACLSLQERRFFAVDSSAAQQAATWCHCETGGLVAYVQGYNVFLLDVPSGQRTQVTADGTPDGRVRNGIADWVYEVRAFVPPRRRGLSDPGRNSGSEFSVTIFLTPVPECLAPLA